jgi:hypothetical protein
MTTVRRSVRLRTVLGWPVGIAAVSWRYMWRTIPLHRSEETGTRADLPSPAYTSGGFADGLQPLDAGVGPMLHRSYGVRIAGTTMTPRSTDRPGIHQAEQGLSRDGGVPEDSRRPGRSEEGR